MVFDLNKFVKALVVAVVVGLVCILGGSLLVTMNVPPATAVGGFLNSYAWGIGLVAGFYYYFFK